MTNALPNKEIIDATQDAVLNVASSVAQVLENTASEFEAEPFYLEAEFWVGAAFVLVVLALAKPIGKALYGALKQRSENIAQSLQDAASLKEDAQKLLAEYERKFRGVEKEANDILLKSEREIENLKKEAIARLEAEMKTKEKETQTRLKAAENDAAQEIANKTADVTLNAVKRILHDSLDDKAQDQLINSSINNLKNLFDYK